MENKKIIMSSMYGSINGVAIPPKPEFMDILVNIPPSSIEIQPRGYIDEDGDFKAISYDLCCPCGHSLSVDISEIGDL